MEITASAVKDLREKTGAGMMDCKRALVEANGDMQQAERILSEMGLAAAASRSGRATREGRVFTGVGEDAAAILEIGCETDFVARNAQFVSLGNELLETMRQQKLATDAPQITQRLTQVVATIKENITLGRYHSMPIEANELVAEYVHGDSGSIGVLVKFALDQPQLRSRQEVSRLTFDIALHVAACNPLYLSQKHVDEEYLQQQKTIFRKQAEHSGKPEKLLDSIAQGKLRKHMQEICLLEQPFVRDDKLNVAQVIERCSTQIGAAIKMRDFIYLRVGAA